jgi:hypothetical protein
LPPLLLRLLPGGANQFPGGFTPAVDQRLFKAHSGNAASQELERECCCAWPNKSAVAVKGAHFLPEDSPEEVGSATAGFVAKVLAGQIR